MLKITNVHKTFNPNSVNEKNALAGVSLYLKAGDFVTVIGSNGAGKSTLLNAIAGSIIPDQGHIWIGEHDVTFWPEYKRSSLIGRVFQDPLRGTASNMTIEENLALALRRGQKRHFRKAIGDKERTFFKEKLELLGLDLENRLNHKVGLLSGGQRQAITLLMATLTRPQILLLDEHTASLDPKTANKVILLTKQLVKENKLTALMVTHDLQQALDIGNRTIMMHEGKIIFELRGEERRKASVTTLMGMFEKASGRYLANDRMLFV